MTHLSELPPTDPSQPLFFLRGESLALFFKRLCARSRTGVLTLREGGTARAVVLDQGRPVFATSSDREERLNGHLLRLGLVSLADLVMAIDRMLKENRRLGEILIETGLLEEARLKDALAVQVREIICRMLPAADGQFGFHAAAPMGHHAIGFNLQPNALIRESLLRVEGFHRVLDEIGGLTAIFQRTPLWEEEVAAAGLTAPQAEVLSLLDEPSTLLQVCSRSRLTDHATSRLIWVGLAIGALARLE
jgi:hypothetical protein